MLIFGVFVHAGPVTEGFKCLWEMTKQLVSKDPSAPAGTFDCTPTPPSPAGRCAFQGKLIADAHTENSCTGECWDKSRKKLAAVTSPPGGAEPPASSGAAAQQENSARLSAGLASVQAESAAPGTTCEEPNKWKPYLWVPTEVEADEGACKAKKEYCWVGAQESEGAIAVVDTTQGKCTKPCGQKGHRCKVGDPCNPRLDGAYAHGGVRHRKWGTGQHLCCDRNTRRLQRTRYPNVKFGDSFAKHPMVIALEQVDAVQQLFKDGGQPACADGKSNCRNVEDASKKISYKALTCEDVEEAKLVGGGCGGWCVLDLTTGKGYGCKTGSGGRCV